MPPDSLSLNLKESKISGEILHGLRTRHAGDHPTRDPLEVRGVRAPHEGRAHVQQVGGVEGLSPSGGGAVLPHEPQITLSLGQNM